MPLIEASWSKMMREMKDWNVILLIIATETRCMTSSALKSSSSLATLVGEFADTVSSDCTAFSRTSCSCSSERKPPRLPWGCRLPGCSSLDFSCTSRIRLNVPVTTATNRPRSKKVSITLIQMKIIKVKGYITGSASCNRPQTS